MKPSANSRGVLPPTELTLVRSMDGSNYGLPASFPAAWRDGSHKQPPAPPPLAVDAALGFLQPALRTLATATSAQANTLATAALAARQCQRLLRPCDAGGSSSSRNDYFLPPAKLLGARERRGLDPRCILILDFAMTVREAPRDAVRVLGKQMRLVAAARTDSDVYVALAVVPGLLDALRIGVGDELAPIFGAAAAMDGSSAAILRTVTRRVRTVGRLLKHAARESLARCVLVGEHQDLVNASGTHDELEEDAVISVPAATALGAETPLVPTTVRWLRSVGERHAAFQDEMRAFLEPRQRSWTLHDALIPCSSVPIRTKHYIAFMTAVAEQATRVVAAVSGDELGVPTAEGNAAWALAALASAIETAADLQVVVADWSTSRAHAPPPHEAWLWTTARAVLAQPSLAADALGSLLPEASPQLALLCLATRTSVGVRLLATDAALASQCFQHGVLRCVSDSPTGVLELGVYESGFSEWGDSGDAAAAAALADTMETCAAAALEADAAAIDAVLRLSLLPENLMSRPWKVAVDALQPSLERAIVRGGRHSSLATAFPDADEREAALRAVVFRRRCWRAVVDMQRSRVDHTRQHAALVTWLGDESATQTVVFARSFAAAPASTADAVLYYEKALRSALAAADGQFERLSLSARSKTLERVRLSSEMTFVDAASHAALCGGDVYGVSSTTDGTANRRGASTAVSTLYWPKA